MNKKHLAVSALLLSHALTHVTTPAFASGSRKKDDLELSTEEMTIQGKQYKLVLSLDRSRNPRTAYQFIGHVELHEKGNEVPYVTGFSDSGNMTFQHTGSANGHDTYSGSYCSTTFDCLEFTDGQKFELIYDQVNASWQVRVNANFVPFDGSGEDGALHLAVNISEMAFAQKIVE